MDCLSRAQPAGWPCIGTGFAFGQGCASSRVLGRAGLGGWLGLKCYWLGGVGWGVGGGTAPPPPIPPQSRTKLTHWPCPMLYNNILNILYIYFFIYGLTVVGNIKCSLNLANGLTLVGNIKCSLNLANGSTLEVFHVLVS